MTGRPRHRHRPAAASEVAQRLPQRAATANARSAGRHAAGQSRQSLIVEPPAPPIALTPLLACDPATDPDILWHIAREAPELRRWLVANPNADAALLEYVAQTGGPGVNAALTVLLDG
ncbi:hypothetical protein JS533_000725 [Bifidobacterium amazonense]|uniref:Leucine rich repeat variant domain-containing protein n=1 Tax=Bifidobacterium amazonense TaxID=2809027 RepID=A0ABS9VRU5_9BIFI|nr:hypothetical protein [Bifidobacterium amazonense]MCH9274814.1 hypothetical protein [Bifidobacterium amazonense]